MEILVLCNVGARDVLLDGKPFEKPRLDGKDILKAVVEHPEQAARLDFPIIEPCLEYALVQHPECSLRLVAFGSDQDDPSHRERDTLFSARLAAHLLPARLGQDRLRAEFRDVQGINPSLYDETFEKYAALLADLSCIECLVCYVILAGGTPASNTALLLQGVRYYTERLQVVYPPQGGEPQRLRIGRQVLDSFQRAATIEHLERLDFANALPYLNKLGANPGIAGLVSYAAKRFSFDFRSAQVALEKALEEGDPALRAFIHKELRHDLDILSNATGDHERLAALLRELYWNAEITYQHHRYADFLGRVYRFQEAVLRYMVETIYQVSTDLGMAVREQNQRNWEERILRDQSLLKTLESTRLEGKPLDWRNISRPVYKVILSYALSPDSGGKIDGEQLVKPKDRDRLQALFKKVNALDRLVELRHRTIIGHDFEGVSAELLTSNCPVKGSPPTALAEIMGMLGQEIHRSAYQKIADFIIRRL